MQQTCRHELPIDQCGLCQPREAAPAPAAASAVSVEDPHPKVYSEISVGREGVERGTVELATYRQRYPTLLDAMERDVSELLETGIISAAVKLRAETRQHLNGTEFPMYFVGDLDAPIVLVHLNPKQPDVLEDLHSGDFAFDSIEAYFDAHRHFGEYAYGRFSTGKHYSRFDAKQIRFLRPFGLIDFVEESSASDRATNLERAIDTKLQMELIPYGSRDFNAKRFSVRALASHVDRLLGVIAAVERKFVIFCGSVFEPVFGKYVVKQHEFYLPTSQGTDRQKSRFANLVIPTSSGEIKAGLAHSWPRQGIPMTAYGEEVKARYE